MNESREHEAYAYCVGGGWEGYQGRCHDCDWQAEITHPPGSKSMAQRDAIEHRKEAGMTRDLDEE